MKIFRGKGVCPAVASGRASLFKRRNNAAEKFHVSDKASEIKRLSEAKDKSKLQLEEIRQKALFELGEKNAQIFEMHSLLIDDEDFNGAIVKIIEEESLNAEYAVSKAGEMFSEMFASMDDAYMKARAADIRDISERIIKNLSPDSQNEIFSSQNVICAFDLSPSETVLLDKSKVVAFVTASGSAGSHTAILARNMNIPAVIGIGEEFLSSVKDGDFVCVDGFTGEVFINPDHDTALRLSEKGRIAEEERELLKTLKGKPNVTSRGKSVNIFANIGSVEDVESVIENDAGGIGLFRSEFLYLERETYPDEEEQFQSYKKVLERMDGKKVIVRTLDIGADKRAGYFNLPEEENPALGLRAIRLCLERPEIFITQLRALYRASIYGNLSIMFPMITSVSEIEKIMSICDRVKNDLKREGVTYSDNVETGIMIETPAAAIISDILAPMVDFFSVGTNDLIQYTLACDRQNPNIDSFCDSHHESVLRLIEMSAKNAHKNGKWIGICGELAADTSLTQTFLNMGIDELSVSPPSVLHLRHKIRSL